jgi:hypothetical protein
MQRNERRQAHLLWPLKSCEFRAPWSPELSDENRCAPQAVALVPHRLGKKIARLGFPAV